jgi:hypothetical protein
MENELSRKDQSDQRTAPGGAPDAPGVTPPTSVSQDDLNPPTLGASSRATRRDDDGAARRNAAYQAGQGDQAPEPHPWAPPGDDVLTTREARLYLYDRYDMLLATRRIQKFTDKKINNPEHRTLIAEVEPKKGGGVQLLIAKSSLDAFGTHEANQHYRNAHETALDPNDPDFDDLRTIASRKPYQIAFNALVTETPSETPVVPTSAPRDARPDQPSAQSDLAAQNRRDAALRPTVTPRDAVAREQYEDLKEQLSDYRDLFKDERAKREQAERAREQDGQELEGQLRRLRDEKDEAFGDLHKTIEAYYELSNELNLTRAAYQEARNHLTPGTQLNVDLNQLTNPNQTRLIDQHWRSEQDGT